jgi:hypothetical protein
MSTKSLNATLSHTALYVRAYGQTERARGFRKVKGVLQSQQNTSGSWVDVPRYGDIIDSRDNLIFHNV